MTTAHNSSAPGGQSRVSVQWLNPDEDTEWDDFVGRHPQGLIYHLSAWKQVLQDAFPHIRGRFLALRRAADGKIQAGLPVYTVQSWLLGNRIVSVPFASFCNPLISSASEFNVLFPEIEKLYIGSKANEVEIRTTSAAALADSGLTPRGGYKHHYLSLEKDVEALYQSLAKSSIRQKITQAKNAGVEITERADEGALKICHAILSETRRRHSLPAFPYAFFQAMKRRLWPGHLKVFIASQAGKPVAFHLILTFKDLWISEYSGNNEDAVAGANQLIYWETIRLAHAAGAKTFSFGRTSATNEGLRSYKKRWATVEGDLFDFTLASKAKLEAQAAPANPREHSSGYRLMRMLLSKAPMPVYRMIGNYCYRHLG